MTTDPRPKMTFTQTSRLRSQARFAVEAYNRLLQAKIGGSGITGAYANFMADQQHFDELMMHWGILPGDRIRIEVEGPYEGSEGVVTDWYAGHFQVEWDKGSPAHLDNSKAAVTPRAAEVEMIKPGSS